MNRTICCGFALAVVVGCGPMEPRPAETPWPDDQVSVGYQTQSKRDLTSATTSFTPSDIDAHVTRVEDMLQARVPGLEVLRLGSGSYTIRIRGPNTFSRDPAASEPLLVIDDVPMSSGPVSSVLAGMSPTEIARIDVLRDGAAAIYGSRAAGGVILITTKRGRWAPPARQ